MIVQSRVSTTRDDRGRAKMHDLGRLSGRCVFVSDVHLKRPDDGLTRLFLSFLKSLQGEADHLFLVGDIFEFIDGASAFFQELWSPIFAVLGELKSAGCCVYFLEGNHDFGFAARGSQIWVSDWADLAGDFACVFEHDSAGSVHVRHGDDVVASQAYLQFRAWVKDARLQRLLRVIPGRLMHEICLWFAERSRAAGAYRPLEEDLLRQCVISYLREGHDREPQSLVLGHIHVFSDAVGSSGQLFSGPDWPSAPSFLALERAGNWSRHFLHPDKNVPVFLSCLD
jgi:UDP-2,3-diacylglucosamine hydrolase